MDSLAHLLQKRLPPCDLPDRLRSRVGERTGLPMYYCSWLRARDTRESLVRRHAGAGTGRAFVEQGTAS